MTIGFNRLTRCIVAGSVLLSACTPLHDVNTLKSFRPTKDEAAPSHINGFDQDEAVRTITVSAQMMRPIVADIPSETIQWPTVTVDIQTIPEGTTLQQAIEMAIALAHANGWKPPIGLVVTDRDAAAHPLNLMRGISGPFRDVVKRLAANGRSQVVWRDGAIEVSRDAPFIVQLPPTYADNTTESIAALIESALGKSATPQAAIQKNQDGTAPPVVNTSVKIDKLAHMISFSADAAHQRQVETILEQLRSRPLLTYECYLWDVSLSDQNEYGINFSQLTANGTNLSAVTDSGLTALTGGMSLAGTLASKMLSVSALGNFLRSQGTTRTLMHARIAFISGMKGDYKDGGTQRIITGVGQPGLVATTSSSSSLPGTAATTSALATTTTYEDIKFGMEMAIEGEFQGDSVWSNIKFTSDDINTLNPTNVNGVEVDRPNINKHGFGGPVRIQPGEVLLLGATHNRAQSRTSKGPFGIGGVIPVPSDDNSQASIGELVLAMRVSLTRYVYGDDAEIYRASHPEPPPPPSPPPPARVEENQDPDIHPDHDAKWYDLFGRTKKDEAQNNAAPPAAPPAPSASALPLPPTVMLRGAEAGKAWIENANGVFPVTEGQTVPGLGKVTSIRPVASAAPDATNQWVVETESGTLSGKGGAPDGLR